MPAPPQRPAGGYWRTTSVTRTEFCYIGLPTPEPGETIYRGSFVLRFDHPGYSDAGNLYPVFDPIAESPITTSIYNP